MVTTGKAAPLPQTRWTLLRDFTLLLLQAVILPALLIGMVVLALSARKNHSIMQERLSWTAKAGAAAVDSQLRGHMAAAQMLAERIDGKAHATAGAAWAAELASLHRYFPGFVSLEVIDAQGRSLASKSQHGPSDGAPRHALASRVASLSSATVIGREPGRDGMSVVAPLKSAGGEPSTLVGTFDPATLFDAERLRLPGRDLDIVILDRTHSVLYSSSGVLQRPVSTSTRDIPWRTVARAGSTRATLLPASLRAGGDAYAQAQRAHNGWTVVALTPADALDAALRRDAAVLVAMMALVVAGVLGMVWLRSRRQARLVNGLLRQIRRNALQGGGQDPAPTATEPPMPVELAPLAAALANLSERITEAQTETEDALKEQRRLREELRAAARKLLVIQEQERRSISRELHDDIGQAITAIKLGAMALDGEDVETQRAIAAEIVATSDQSIKKLRNLALLLRPPQLDALGLEAALKGQVEILARNPKASIELSCTALPERPSAEVEVACFRVAQEAITNALRHAGSTTIRVTLSPHEQGVLLQVKDDGEGIAANARSGLGLVTMRERTEQLGGRLTIESGKGHGTVVQAWLPSQAAEGVD